MYIFLLYWHRLIVDQSVFGGQADEKVVDTYYQYIKGIFIVHTLHDFVLLWYDMDTSGVSKLSKV